MISILQAQWQLVLIVTLIILTSTFILYTRNTIYCLLSLICLVLALSWFLVYAGLELIGFMFTTIYLGAILVFFIFVIMLIDLRFEDLQDLYSEAKTYEPQDFTLIYPIVLFSSAFCLDLLVERVLYDEYSGMEYFLSFPGDTPSGLASEYLTEYIVEHTHSPTSVGFYLFSVEGASVGILTLLILFSLYISLYTVHEANEAVSKNNEETANRTDEYKKFP